MLQQEQAGALDALAAAYRELGSTPEEATAEATEHLRRAQRETEMHVAAQRVASRRTTCARPAMLLALGLFGLFYLADVTRLAGRWWEAHYDRASEVTFYRLEALLVPLLAGLAVGLLVRAHAVRGTFYALALLAIGAVWIPAILYALSVTDLMPFSQSSVWHWSIWSPAPGLVGLAFWPPLGCLGAGIGGWLRRQGQGGRRAERRPNPNTI